MLAETAYNVIQALPEAEKARLYSMLKLEEKAIKPKVKKDDGHWTPEQAKEYLMKVFTKQAKRHKNRKPEAVTSGFKTSINQSKSN